MVATKGFACSSAHDAPLPRSIPPTKRLMFTGCPRRVAVDTVAEPRKASRRIDDNATDNALPDRQPTPPRCDRRCWSMLQAVRTQEPDRRNVSRKLTAGGCRVATAWNRRVASEMNHAPSNRCGDPRGGGLGGGAKSIRPAEAPGRLKQEYRVPRAKCPRGTVAEMAMFSDTMTPPPLGPRHFPKSPS